MEIAVLGSLGEGLYRLCNCDWIVMANSRWNNVKEKDITWMGTFNRILSESKLPELSGSSLYVTSDYSGYDSKSKYFVISILVADLDNSKRWEYFRRSVRSIYMADGRRMSFKKLNDANRLKALVPFLEASDEIEGLCLSIGIRKEIKNLYIDKKAFESVRNKGVLKGNWSAKSLENMFRIVHFISIVIAGLVKPNQNICWISDEDEILANPTRSSDVAGLISAFTSMYVEHNLGELGVGTTRLDEGDRLEEDFAAIADLAAGAISEMLTKVGNTNPSCSFYDNTAHELPDNLSKKTEVILAWLGDDCRRLKKCILLFEQAKYKMYGLTRLQLG
jgi:hypothetical protein